VLMILHFVLLILHFVLLISCQVKAAIQTCPVLKKYTSSESCDPF
jgi:hypothetical protein